MAETKKAAVVKKPRKAKVKVLSGEAHVLATFTNTMVTITDESGNTLVQYSPSRVGFKNSKKKTPYAATKAAFAAASEAIDKYGLREVKVYVKGAGVGRNAAVKGLASAGLAVTLLADVTRTPHNGCRPPRKPRK
ncbi:MAG: 30S ribosomal protein S11 [Candidatus Dojkabacteria bacterium]|nr:MAG: 30S ribosomal protein S11 [Candidatus Dojkabacteria bacterium]